MEVSLGYTVSSRLTLASDKNLLQKTEEWRCGSVGKMGGCGYSLFLPLMHRPWVPAQHFKKKTRAPFHKSISVWGVELCFWPWLQKGFCLHPFQHPFMPGSYKEQLTAGLGWAGLPSLGRNGNASIKFHSDHLESGSNT